MSSSPVGSRGVTGGASGRHPASALVPQSSTGDRRQGMSVCESIPLLLENGAQQTPRGREEVADGRVGQPIEDMAGATFGLDQTVTSQHREVLRQVRWLESGLALEFGDAHLALRGEQFEDPNAKRVREPFEESGLDLVERSLAVR